MSAGIKEACQQSLRFYARHLLLLVGTAALALLPAQLVSAGLGSVLTGLSPSGLAPVDARPRLAEKTLPGAESVAPRGPPRTETEAALERDQTEPPPLLPIAWLGPLTVGLLWLVSAVIGLFGAFLAGAALVPIVAAPEPERCTPAHAWAAAAPRLPQVILAALLASLLVGVGLVCLVLPGVAVAIGLAFTTPVVLLEGLSGSAALRRAWSLMRREWRAALALSLFYAGGTLLVQSALAQLAPASAPWARMAVSGAVAIVLRPLHLVAIAQLYLRARLNTSS